MPWTGLGSYLESCKMPVLRRKDSMNILSVITQILVLVNAVTNTVITLYRVKKVIKEKENSTCGRPKQ